MAPRQLHEAASEGQCAAVKVLLKVPNIDVNVVCRNGKTPLHHAVTCKDSAMVKALLEVPNTELSAAVLSIAKRLPINSDISTMLKRRLQQ